VRISEKSAYSFAVASVLDTTILIPGLNTMPFTFECPACGVRLKSKSQNAPDALRCPKCFEPVSARQIKSLDGPQPLASSWYQSRGLQIGIATFVVAAGLIGFAVSSAQKPDAATQDSRQPALLATNSDASLTGNPMPSAPRSGSPREDVSPSVETHVAQPTEPGPEKMSVTQAVPVPEEFRAKASDDASSEPVAETVAVNQPVSSDTDPSVATANSPTAQDSTQPQVNSPGTNTAQIARKTQPQPAGDVVGSAAPQWPRLERVTADVRWPHPQLTDGNYSEWVDFIWPTKQELKWQDVRWHTELEDAAREAGQLQRPVLLWTMNGHPCGET
jgi:hypothetical protein